MHKRLTAFSLAVVLAAGLSAAGIAPRATAAEIAITPQDNLQQMIDAASPGDVLRLAAGIHRGPARIDKQIVLEGDVGAEVRGPGEGSAISVTAPNTVVRGLKVTGSGKVVSGPDAGIFLAQTATGTIVENNDVVGNLYGIYVRGAVDALVRGNRISGFQSGRSTQAGNGVTVWNAPGARVLDNDIRYGRDGIFVSASKRNTFNGNRFSNLRFAIHYMYTNDSEISGNVSSGNSVGYAMMYSHRLTMRNNLSDGDRDHGFLFNYANGSTIEGNKVLAQLQPASRWVNAGVQQGDSHGVPSSADAGQNDPGKPRLGPEKCVFIYNANQNSFRDNWFEGCEIGVHFTAGSERNEITGNAFVRNRSQVKYVGTRYLDWSAQGRGNYWSDNAAFDLNGDGIADSPYRPNGLVDRILWTAPQAKILMNSPAVQVIRWAQAQFPALLPGGVVDTHPLMAPPARPGVANPL